MSDDERPRTIRILWIENDQEFTDLMTKLLKRRLKPHEVDIVVARHVKDAGERLKDGASGFAALIVDIMLPKDQAAVEEAERLEQRRRELLHQLQEARSSRAADTEEQVRRLRALIDGSDAELERQTDLEGGLRVLEGATPPKLSIPTMFLTARGAERLKERAHELVAEDCFHWLQKPVEVSVIVEVLRRCLARPEGKAE